MIAEKEYIKEVLKQSGIKSQIYTSMKKLKASNETHVAAILLDGETFERSNSKKKFVDEDGTIKVRKKLFQREIRLRVVISDNSEEKVEEIAEHFLKQVGTGFILNKNWVDIWIEEAEWLFEGDHILKGKAAVELKITLKHGIYQEEDMKQVELIGQVRRL